jgi:hypothetical protein
MNKTLLIITRKHGEFDKYWNGGTDKLPYDESVFKPIIINASNSLKAIIISPAGMSDENPKEFGKEIGNALKECEENLDGELVGIIVHGKQEFNAIKLKIKQLEFIEKYSSTKGSEFCVSRNGNFIANRDSSIYRNGVLDAFRDAYILNRGDIEMAFNNLWNYFVGDQILYSKLTILHQCLNPDELKNINPPEGLKSEFQSFMEAVNENCEKGTSPFNDKYIEQLSILRDNWFKN